MERPESVPGSTAAGLKWPLLIASLAIAGIVVMYMIGGPKAEPSGDRISHAAFLDSRFSPEQVFVATAGLESKTLRFDARGASVAIIETLPAIWTDPKSRETLKTLGFETITVRLPGEVDSTISLEP